jgi:collagen type VII alpha
MKKVFLVLPFAIVLANCSSTRNTNSTSANSGINASAGTTAGTGVNSNASTSGTGSGSTASTDAGASAGNTSTGSTTGAGATGTSGATGSSSVGSTGSSGSTSAPASTGSAGSGSSNISSSSATTPGSGNSTSGSTGSWNSNSKAGASTASRNNNSSTKSSGSINWDVYDPNNFMQNPDKYRKPYEIEKAGGWTYSKDWRRNTNFTAEAVGEWQLTITPEVAAYWKPDTRRPETYASFWTPEAVMARYQATVAAIKKTQDSIAALTATTAGTNTTGNANANAATASANTSTVVTGSGSTGTMGTGGTSSTTGSTASSATSDSTANAGAAATVNSSLVAPFTLTAVNGNNYLLPKLNLFIDNGSFTAYTGCNNAIGKIIVNGSALHFEEATPSSNIECIGGFDQSAFVDRLRRADSYDVVNNQFRLKQGEQVLMTFAKNTNSQKY